MLYLNWENVSKYQSSPPNFILYFHHKLKMKLISKHQRLSENVIEKLEHIFDWNEISKSQIYGEKFILKFSNKINWFLILKYQNLSEVFVNNHFQVFLFSILAEM